METGLAGKRVLVTGGSGGIGAACARAFCARAPGSRCTTTAGATAPRRWAPRSPSEPTSRTRRRSTRSSSEARAALGGLDACVAVAGVWPSEDVPVWELPLERWEETLRANLTAAFLTARAYLRELEREGHGSLVLIASTAGLYGEAGHADYAAAKSAVAHGLLLSLKNEVVRVAPKARVNVVAPGWTESPMTRGHVDPEAIRKISRTMALRKVAQPEDVAAAVVVPRVRRPLRPRDRTGRDGRRRHGRPDGPPGLNAKAARLRAASGSSKPQVIAVSPRPEDSWARIGTSRLTL